MNQSIAERFAVENFSNQRKTNVNLSKKTTRIKTWSDHTEILASQGPNTKLKLDRTIHERVVQLSQNPVIIY